MQRETRKSLLLLSLFATAMGWLEGVVVVYLRALYFPSGFSFPLVPMDSSIVLCELLRELCTLIMLGSVAMLAERDRVRRAAAFLWIFGVWDLVYYLALKVHLNWPPSLLTWDLLFLIPVGWVGPVLAPILCSLLMVFLAAGLYRCTEKWEPFRFGLLNWNLLLSGSVLILVSFMRLSASKIPAPFLWPIFLTGFFLLSTVTVRICLQAGKPKKLRFAA